MAENMIEITVADTKFKLTGKPATIIATAGAVLATGYCLINHKTTLPRLEEFFRTRSGGFVKKFGKGCLLVTVVTETEEAKNLMLEQAASGELLTALNNMEGLNAEERFEKLEIVELHTKMVTSHELEQIKHEAQRNVQKALEHGLLEETLIEHVETEETWKKKTTKRMLTIRKHQPPSKATAETSKSETSNQTFSDQPSKKIKLSPPEDFPVEICPQPQKYCLEDIFYENDTSNPEEANARMSRMYNSPAQMPEANFHLDYYSVLMMLRHYDKAQQVRTKLTAFISEKIEVNGEGLQEFASQLSDEERFIEAIFFYTLAAEAYLRQDEDTDRSEGLVTCVEGLTVAAINFNDAAIGQKPYLRDNVFPLIEKVQLEISEAGADRVYQARMNSSVGQFELEIFKHRDKALKLLEKAAPVLQASDLYQNSGGCFRMIGAIHENMSKFVEAMESFKKAKNLFNKEKKQLDPDDSEDIVNVFQDIKECETSIKKCALRLKEIGQSDSGHPIKDL